MRSLQPKVRSRLCHKGYVRARLGLHKDLSTSVGGRLGRVHRQGDRWEPVAIILGKMRDRK